DVLRTQAAAVDQLLMGIAGIDAEQGRRGSRLIATVLPEGRRAHGPILVGILPRDISCPANDPCDTGPGASPTPKEHHDLSGGLRHRPGPHASQTGPLVPAGAAGGA